MSSLSKNIGSLFIVQLANYLIPLTTLPWLTRVLGPAQFGQMSFVTAVVTYFVLFTDYGFNLSATKEIAICRDDLTRRSAIFWNTIGIKAALAAVGLAILLSALLLLRLTDHANLYLIGYLAVLGSVMTPTWYFQGMEHLSVLGAINVSVRALTVPAVLLFVTKPDDLPYAIAINSGASVMIGAACLLRLFGNRSVVLTRVSSASLIATLRSGWHIFLATASVSLYSTSNAVLLGVISGHTAVGYYSAAEKLIKAVQGLLTPVSQSVYPRVSHLMHHSRREALRLIRRLLEVQGAATFAVSALMFFAAPLIVRMVYGVTFAPTVGVLRWMAWVPFAVGLSNVFGIQVMVPLGMQKAFSRVVMVGGAFNVIVLAGLAGAFGARGAAMAVLATEILVTILMAAHLFRNRAEILGLPGCS